MNKICSAISCPDDLQDESAEQVYTMGSINSFGSCKCFLVLFNAVVNVSNLGDKNSDNAPSSVKNPPSD